MSADVLTAALGRCPLVPLVASGVDPRLGSSLARSMAAAGATTVEVALRTPDSLEVLRAMAAARELLVGAGTVLSADQVDVACEAGARYVVSPGLSEAVVARCREHGVPVLPGVATASDLMRADELGVRRVKFFPAEVAGGPPALRALSAPFPDVRFVPTGGIDADNAPDYLALGCVVAVGGSWMTPAGALADGDVGRVAALTAAAVALVGAS